MSGGMLTTATIRRIRAAAVLGVTLMSQASIAQVDADGMLGVLTPRSEISIEPAIEGQIVAIDVRIGDTVAAGDVLAILDDEELQSDLDAAEGRLQAAEAQLLESEARVRIAEDTLARQRALLESQAVSVEAVRSGEQAVELARAAADQSRAVVRQQQAARDQQSARLRQTRIRAPFAGSVAERYVNVGVTVGPGMPLLRLIGSNELWARFAAPVDQADRLAVGRGVSVSVVDIGRTLSGSIRQVGAEVDPASGMIICEAAVVLPPDWNGPPLSGQTVRVRFDD